jgi:diguanylate cyclase (GGDEF)-like protein
MSRRVLLIDDSLPLHQILRSHLGGLDVDLHSALDGTTGLAAAARLRPSAILLDLDLPDLGGFEVCRQLQQSPETSMIPVIFLTAAGGPSEREAGLGLGAVAFLTKPFKVDELSARVLSAIRARWDAEQAAGLDEVTGLWTRARLDRHLAGLPAVTGPGGEPMACVVADVNGLRLVNARHGHAVGDRVLRAVGQVFQAHRPSGRDACWAGGGRFGLLLGDLDRRAAGRLAERIRVAVRDAPIPDGVDDARVTCSFGVADTRVAARSTLVGRAEGALARAKQNGLARICVARIGRRSAA